MNPIDQKIHDYIHEKMLMVPPDKIFSWRKGALRMLQRKFPDAFRGRVCDMGAGSGYLSILLARVGTVEEVLCVEASSRACRELLPRNINFHNQETKIEVIESSFDNILPKKSNTIFFFIIYEKF